MQGLSPKNKQSLKSLLVQMHRDLEEQLSLSEAAIGIVTLDQTTIGRITRMDAMQQQSMAAFTREKAALRLRKVTLALHNMDHDEYGYCKKCDELIALPRLLAQPEANLCLSCQDRADGQQ